jgi:hypothetical protein
VSVAGETQQRIVTMDTVSIKSERGFSLEQIEALLEPLQWSR